TDQNIDAQKRKFGEPIRAKSEGRPGEEVIAEKKSANCHHHSWHQTAKPAGQQHRGVKKRKRIPFVKLWGERVANQEAAQKAPDGKAVAGDRRTRLNRGHKLTLRMLIRNALPFPSRFHIPDSRFILPLPPLFRK